jgi:hypothetical protein
MCARTREKCPAVDVAACAADKESQIDMAQVAGCSKEFVMMTTCAAQAPLDAITCFENRGDFAPGTCQAELDAYNDCSL